MTAARHDLTVWRLLLLILETGELTSAAIALDMDPSKASRRIRQLEEEIGVALLDRSVRPIRATPAAERLVSHVGVLLEDAVRLQESCRRERAEAAKRQDDFSLRRHSFAI